MAYFLNRDLKAPGREKGTATSVGGEGLRLVRRPRHEATARRERRKLQKWLLYATFELRPLAATWTV